MQISLHSAFAMANNRLIEILNHYRQLITYCDEFFARVQQSHAHEMSCSRGCSFCCTLQTVCALEAAVIASWIEQSSGLDMAQIPQETHVCPLLDHHLCLAYEVRPVLCRTHGLLLAAEQRTIRSCQLNFPLIAPGEIPAHDILDNERITMNLMKLNLAFAMEIGRRDEAERRFNLRDVINGRLPRVYMLSR